MFYFANYIIALIRVPNARGAIGNLILFDARTPESKPGNEGVRFALEFLLHRDRGLIENLPASAAQTGDEGRVLFTRGTLFD